MKTAIEKTSLGSYFSTVYTAFIRNPYWRTRRYFDDPICRQILNTEACFYPDPQIENYHEFYSETKYIKNIIRTASEDDVFYDIGANIGLYSYFVANSGVNCFAFEPSPTANRYLRYNQKYNSTVCNNQIVVSDTDGIIEFAVDTSDSLGRMSSINESSEGVEYKQVSIGSRRIDSLVLEDSYPRPDILKIDVEGAEEKVLSGMKNLSQYPKAIFCEIHKHRLPDYGSTGEEVYDILDKMGYSIEVIQNRGPSDFIKATS